MPVDNNRFSMGAAGETDYYQTFNGSDAQFFSARDIVFLPTRAVEIVTSINTPAFIVDSSADAFVIFELRFGIFCLPFFHRPCLKIADMSHKL